MYPEVQVGALRHRFQSSPPFRAVLTHRLNRLNSGVAETVVLVIGGPEKELTILRRLLRKMV